MGSRSFLPLGTQWVDSNRFSILANLGREGDPWSVEEVGDVFLESQTEVYDSSDPHTGNEFSGLFGSREHECGPLECVPLSQWDPKATKDMVLNRVEEEGA